MGLRVEVCLVACLLVSCSEKHGSLGFIDETVADQNSPDTTQSSSSRETQRLLSDALEFNVLSCGDFRSGYSDVEGKLAAAGSIELWHYSVGIEDPGPLTTVSGLNVDIEHGTIHGDVVYGAEISINNATVEGASYPGSPVNFGVLTGNMPLLSNTLAPYAPTGTVEFEPDGWV
ncbi:MAG: choice-of-anchor A family protein, partial [Proteobacteria bacterium]|nr:choice-of-anchor A family protein [Pseudomonadota bacterium]